MKPGSWFRHASFWLLCAAIAACALASGKASAQPTTVTCDNTCTFTLTLDAATAVEQSRAAALAVLSDPSVLGITSGNIAVAMGFGLGFVLLMWCGGYVAGVAAAAIRRV
jgi:hypothetical protein